MLHVQALWQKLQSSTNTQNHYKTVHEGYHFKCDREDCNLGFTCKDQLKVHLLEHDGKFQFICELCTKGYNHKGNFESHLNTHLGQFIYKCY